MCLYSRTPKPLPILDHNNQLSYFPRRNSKPDSTLNYLYNGHIPVNYILFMAKTGCFFNTQSEAKMPGTQWLVPIEVILGVPQFHCTSNWTSYGPLSLTKHYVALSFEREHNIARETKVVRKVDNTIL